MNIITKPLSELRKPDKNVRRHTEKQIKEYVRSIEMFGQIKPVVIDETGEIIAGNGLFEALQRMGAETCSCYVMEGLTENQKKKLMLADNRVYELGITDTSVFDELIRELGGDVDVPGWDADLLAMLTSSVADTNDMVESYGVYDQSEVDAVSGRERVDHTTPPVPTSAAAHSGGDDAQTQTERFVICPNCGERICL